MKHYKGQDGNWIRIRMWFGGYKQAALVGTIVSLIRNMINGVRAGVVYKMRLVHAHFPINAIIGDKGASIQVKNFLGCADIPNIKMQPGVKVRLSTEVKDELIFEGIDKAAVSLSCAQVSQVCKIGKKDERKFLDGIFVSQRTVQKVLD